MPCCQFGIGWTVLIPPLLPVPAPQFQTVSDTQLPPGPVVVKVVPPTTVIFGSSDGVGIAPVYASLSPDAL
jgi:hypothetical protein